MSVAVTASAFVNESELVARLQNGEPSAYETLVRDYGPRMLSVARRFLRCEQESADAVQDAFLSAFKAIATFQQDSQLSTWLYRIVTNACLMKLRSASRRKDVPIDDLLPEFNSTGHHTRHPRAFAEDALASAQRTEMRQQIRAAIDQLPEAYRTVLLLRDIEELDTEETARALNCTTANVKTRLHRARQALRTLLESSFGQTLRA